MVTIVDAKNKAQHVKDLEQMFAGREGLSLSGVRYDHQDSVYLFFQDPTTGRRGSARLNPMMSPNLTKDTLTDKIKAYEKPYIWECSDLSFGGEACQEPCRTFYKAFHEALGTACARLHIGTLLLLTKSHEIEAMKRIGGIPFSTVLPIDKRASQSLALLSTTYRH